METRKTPKIKTGLIVCVFVLALIAQIPSGYIFREVSKMKSAIDRAYTEILASIAPSHTDVKFVERLKNDLEITQEIKIIIGPYKIVYGNDFRYRLEKRLAFVEHSETAEETYLILIDQTFYESLNNRERESVLAHEMWHIYAAINNRNIPGVATEIEADNFSLRYGANPDTLIELLQKYNDGSSDMQKRIESLERQRPPSR